MCLPELGIHVYSNVPFEIIDSPNSSQVYTEILNSVPQFTNKSSVMFEFGLVEGTYTPSQAQQGIECIIYTKTNGQVR